ncbi:MAG: hypothetical protein U5L96_18065 [Owenweeksia sp.]|nr:hypothetical protein [Owenweeksia sp.]
MPFFHDDQAVATAINDSNLHLYYRENTTTSPPQVPDPYPF